MAKFIPKKKMADGHGHGHAHAHLDHTQHSNSTNLVRIFREYDFFDEHKKGSTRIHLLPLLKNNESQQEILIPGIIKPAMSPSPLKRVYRDDRCGQKKKKTTTNFDLFEGFPIDSNRRMIRLFGVNLMVSGDSETTGMYDDLQEKSQSSSAASCSNLRYQKRIKRTSDDSLDHVHNNPRIIRLFGVNLLTRVDDDQEKKRLKAKGKEKIVDTCCSTKGVIINEEKKKKKTAGKNHSNERNPNNIHRRQKERPIAPVPPLFHPLILGEIQQGHEPPVLLFVKEIQSSDIKRRLNRLLITRSTKLMGFLTEDERRKVEDEKEHLTVITREAQLGNESKLQLTRWPKNGMIVLIREWFKLVVANRLQKGDSVQGWGYRRGNAGEFQLALNIIRKQRD